MRRRRHCNHILQTLTRLIAPVLSFTAEEIWTVMNGANEDSVFLHRYHHLPEVANASGLAARWSAIRVVRSAVLKEIEDKRATGQVGSSLQAEVVVHVQPDAAAASLLKSLGDDLRFVMITSAARVQESATAAELAVAVLPSTHPKCARCWHYRADVGSNVEHPAICGRCVSNLFGEGEKRFYA